MICRAIIAIDVIWHTCDHIPVFAIGLVMQNAAVEILQSERDKISTEIEAHREAARSLGKRLKEIDGAIAQLCQGGAPKEETRAPGGSSSTLTEMVGVALSEFGEGTTALEIAEYLSASGRDTTNTTVSSILHRMKKAGTATKMGSKWFAVVHEKGSAEAEPDSNAGDVAERSIAPDSKSGGAVPEKPVPVGSNPTVSAPFNRDREKFLGGSNLSGASTNHQFPIFGEKGG